MRPKPDTCRRCLGWTWGATGFVPAHGTGTSGLLIVGEAAGEAEAQTGVPFVGKAGQYLWSALKRVGIEREGVLVHNVLSCRPPRNQLVGQPYERAVITSCAPHLDATIAAHREACRARGQTPVIVALGQTAFCRLKRIPRTDPLLSEEYRAYPFWSDPDQCWIYAADHPSYLMRGQHALIDVVIVTIRRALETVTQGLALETPPYLCDPSPRIFDQWVTDTLAQSGPIAFDIETPTKQGEDEDVVRDPGEITRIGFARGPGEACSVPWQAAYLPAIRRLLSAPRTWIGWNARLYDVPIIQRTLPIGGTVIDAMLAWHVLQSHLPKSLGFVAPFYVRTVTVWKTQSTVDAPRYNAQDADMTWRIWQGVEADLHASGLWTVFARHVQALNPVLDACSAAGVAVDAARRAEAEAQLQAQLADLQAQMTALVPATIRPKTLRVRPPADPTGWQPTTVPRTVWACAQCGEAPVRVAHTRPAKRGQPPNPCAGADRIRVVRPQPAWERLDPFVLSPQSLRRYQQVRRHQPVRTAEGRPTFNESAIGRLSRRYPADPLYPLIPRYRRLQKILTTYVQSALQTPDRLHTQFSHNPSTLRLSSQAPNLQNLPRANPADPTDPGNLVRRCIRAASGCLFVARDFAGIEAVLVGYFAQCPALIRLARQDVHTFYTLHALAAQGDPRVSPADLPDLAWPDAQLFAALAAWKPKVAAERNGLYKHLVHAANFGQTARGAAEKIALETGVEHPIRQIEAVMATYFALFPEVRAWQEAITEQAHREGELRNPYGYRHVFHRVYAFQRLAEGWARTRGEQWNEVLAFLPQSTAAGIMKEVLLTLWAEPIGRYLRLTVHDEVILEVPEAEVDAVQRRLQAVMEAPIPVLPLPEAWGLGPALTLTTEGKVGPSWGELTPWRG